MSGRASSIPTGFHSVTPHLVIRGCASAIALYTRAFGAVERFRMEGPAGKLAHAEIRIGDSIVMMSDEMIELGGNPAPSLERPSALGLLLYWDDVDAAWARAIGAGLGERLPLEDRFWGDRYGQLLDPFGFTWAMATHVADYTPEELRARHAAWMRTVPPG